MDRANPAAGQRDAGCVIRPRPAGKVELTVLDGGDATLSDDELLRDFHAGRAAAFGALVRRHERAVRALLRRYVDQPDDVLDLAQRTFLRALDATRRRPWLGLGRSPPFQALVLRIATNLGKNHARDLARWPRAPLEGAELPGEVAAAGSSRLEAADRSRRLRAAVERLPRRQREVLLLRIDAELSFAEIGRALAITENNAKVHFHHATRRLTALVAAEGEEP